MAKKEKPKYTSIAGQALMEGIMMRGPYKSAMVVRRADGSLVIEDLPLPKKSILGKIPIVRGVYAFIYSMTSGTKTLMRSAEIAIEDEEAALAAEETALAAKEAGQCEAAEDIEAAPAVDFTDAEAAAPTEGVESTDAENAIPTEGAESADAEDAIPTEGAESADAEAAAPTDTTESAGAEDAVPTESAESANIEDAAPTEGTDSADTEAIAPTKPEKSGDKSKSKEKSGGESDSAFLTLISGVLGIGLAVLLFIYAPTWITNALVDHAFPWLNNYIPGDWSQVVRDNSVVWRPIIEGVIKMIVFIVYLALCSTMKEIRRLFQFHGAEHKTIFCYESGDELTVENVRRHKRFHPRCGTSFLMLMLIVGIIAGIIIKGLLPVDIRNSAIIYPLIKLCIIPLIMGVGYELLKLAGKHDNIITKIISAPGMWMQRITVKEPDDEMIECAIAAISRVIPDDGTDMQ